MARTTKRTAPEISSPSVSPDVGLTILKRQIERGEKLLENSSIPEGEFNAWQTLSQECVIKSFGRNTDSYYAFLGAGPSGQIIMAGHEPSPSWYENRRRKTLDAQLAELKAMVPVLELEIEVTQAATPRESLPNPQSANTVFIVHGRASTPRDTVARFLEKLQLKAIILHEQPNKGRTIIEKFVDYSDVGFAVVLLTPDDRGGLASEPYDSQKPRARQNVVLELGFFLGKLGRSRVCALYSQGVEIPSDYDGVAFVAFDEGAAWQFALAKELKSAGFKIDMNLL
jgi:predicted nucleotide-binding protein